METNLVTIAITSQAQPIQLLKTQVLRRGEHEPYRSHKVAITGRCGTFQHTPWTRASGHSAPLGPQQPDTRHIGREAQPCSDTTS